MHRHDDLGDALKDHSLSSGRFALNRVALAAVFSVLAGLPGASWALGLGKLNVQSALGESLRAEIDLSSLTTEEGASLQVRVASPETYRAAGVDYNPVLATTNITLQRRADGRPYLRIASDRSVQEPFVDVILDLSWSTGRLVREYTLLFDPPSSRAPAQATSPAITVPSPVTPPPTTDAAASRAPSRPAAERPAEPAVRAERRASRPAPPAPSAPAPAPAPSAPVAEAPGSTPSAAAASSSADSVRVRSGDSLSSIASRKLQPGVSLDQMLVSLYRANPKAFQGNMNRLKAGAVLDLPSADQAREISPQEARKIIIAESADFAAYRQRLAGTVTESVPGQAQRQVKGQVEAEVKDQKQAAAQTPDKLTLSKGGMAAGGNASVEDRLAKSRAKEESTARVAELSKNLDELRQLKEKAAAAPPAPKPAPVPSAPAKPLEDVPSGSPAPASEPLTDAPQVAASEAASATAVANAASEPASAASPVAPVVPAPAPVAPPPAPEPEEPGLLATVNPMLLAAGGAALALLAGGLMFLRSRRRTDSGETSFLESRLQPDSFFGASGGQRVDTRDATGGPSSMSYSLSQLDAIGDVDPVAEADVYLAYGRDLQAEEILKEALRSTPDRLAVRTKLLEVYAKRRDTKGYEQLAVQLFALTGGVGEDWAKAQEMGLGIDPENPLYQPGGRPSEQDVARESTDALGASTVPHSVMPAPSQLDSVAPPVAAEPDDVDMVNLDLDISGPAPLDEVTDSVSPAAVELNDLPPLDLNDDLPDLGNPPASAEPVELPELPAATSPDNAGLDFDLDEFPPAAPAAQPAATPDPAFDMESISLDLDVPTGEAAEPIPAAEVAGEDDWLNQPAADSSLTDPMARKLELADEFRQIGDVDGARELLNEVLDNTQDAALRAKAQGMLDSLG
ncbi:FimV/HubP family polar landmark protein [uncultured Aquabacterium sp.]|jgi:pilus assembly protein FimV|uniref:FimV/HubP family polar landmark protein n=1 Tax=uncultured Aquabacterium sp. TaxID=158753 RepID=UPI00260168F8|nr:FimV/HubP family polar landmark protein [uncultured Aquabacterium sp.]